MSALLADVGLNIREAHVFSTTDGFSLDVFVVDGWPSEVHPFTLHFVQICRVKYLTVLNIFGYAVVNDTGN